MTTQVDQIRVAEVAVAGEAEAEVKVEVKVEGAVEAEEEEGDVVVEAVAEEEPGGADEGEAEEHHRPPTMTNPTTPIPNPDSRLPQRGPLRLLPTRPPRSFKTEKRAPTCTRSTKKIAFAGRKN